jgi:F-type H+-transporting ATPase subunit b
VLLDWFTIIAQIVNFLILLFLLRRFLYRPMINAMQAREDRIAGLLNEAEQKRGEAEQERQRFEAKNREFQDTYEQRQRELETKLDNWQKDAYRDARKEVDETLQDWHRTIEDDKKAFLASLNQFAVRQTYTVARRAVGDLASADLESALVTAFLSKLKNHEVNFETFSNDNQGQPPALRLRSAFALPADGQRQIRSALQEVFGKKMELTFETLPDLISGIELVGESGHTAAWNLRRYLDVLQYELDQQMSAYVGDPSTAQPAEAEGIHDA